MRDEFARRLPALSVCALATVAFTVTSGPAIPMSAHGPLGLRVLTHDIGPTPAQFGGGGGDLGGIDPGREAVERELNRLATREGDGQSLTAQAEAAVKDAAEQLGINPTTALRDLSRATRVSSLTTALIARVSRDTGQRCERLPTRFQVDCVAQGYKALSNTLPRRGDYTDVKRALADVGRELDKITRETRDRSQRRAAARLFSGAPRQRFTPVRPGAERQAAAKILEARQQLLRSVSSSDPRAVHYQRVAASFQDTAVLLRS